MGFAANPAGATPLAPSQVTAPSYRPPAVARPATVEIPAAPAAGAPAGAERLVTKIGRVTIEGPFPEMAQANLQAVRALEGQRVSVAQIFAAANALEQAYAQAGYLLARVTVPQQRITPGGPLKLLVIDGVIEQIDLSGVPARARDIVRRRVAPLFGRKHLTLRQIERALLLAGDAPGLQLQSAIARGDTPAGVKLVLQGRETWVTGGATFDNRLPASLGDVETIANLSLNDTLGLGETAYLSVGRGRLADQGALFDNRFALISLGASAPLGDDGFAVGSEYTHTSTLPVPIAGVPTSRGDFDRFVLRGSYDIERSRAETVRLGVDLGYINQRNTALAFATELDRDSYRYGATSLEFSGATPWSAPIQARVAVAQGLGGRGGEAAFASGVPLSRLGASPFFHKATFDAKLEEPLAQGVRLDLGAKGQWTFGAPVFVSEQFALDGADAVSSFPNGALSVDSGVALRAELTRPFVAAGGLAPSVWSPYLFAAAGVGRLEAPTILETGLVRAAGVGVGMRSQFDLGAARVANLSAEFGRQLSNEPGEMEGYRMFVNLGLQF